MKILQCIYDLAIAPCSYDFFAFLLSAEHHRVRNDFESINLIFLPGPKNGYRADELERFKMNSFSKCHSTWYCFNAINKVFCKTKHRQDFISLFPDNNIFPRGYCIKILLQIM